MAQAAKKLLCLDVGEKRIGVATADTQVGIAVAYGVVEVDGQEFDTLAQLVVKLGIDQIIVGYPRNQAGEPTAQTAYVENFAYNLRDVAEVIYQDESLTSVIAEQRLKARGGTYEKGDIDSEAATIILQDYLESTR